MLSIECEEIINSLIQFIMIRLIKHINNKNVIWKIKKMKKNSNDFDIIDFSQISPQKFEDLAFAYINIIFTEKGTEILPTRWLVPLLLIIPTVKI